MTQTVVQNEQLRRYVETHHIDMIPAAARHGKPWHQSAFWGAATSTCSTSSSAGWCPRPEFWWALSPSGRDPDGALLIALARDPGTRLGVPQTIQSRGQFGFYGAAFLFPAVLLLNIGFIAAEFVIQGQAMQGVAGSLFDPAWIVILIVPSVVIGIFGYRWIHRVMQVTASWSPHSRSSMFVQGLRYGMLPPMRRRWPAPQPGCSSRAWRCW